MAILDIAGGPIWGWFKDNAFPFFKELVRASIAAIWYIAKPYWKISIVVWGLGTLFLQVLVWSWAQIAAQLDALASAKMPSVSGDLLHYYAFVDRFLPLTEAISGWATVGVIWLAVTIIRWIKSFVPTLSN